GGGWQHDRRRPRVRRRGRPNSRRRHRSRSIFERTTLFSQSTRILVDAMKIAGVKRLVAVTGLGAGDSRGRGGIIHGGIIYDSVVFPLLLKRVYDDEDVQEWIIGSSGSIGPSYGHPTDKPPSKPAVTAF